MGAGDPLSSTAPRAAGQADEPHYSWWTWADERATLALYATWLARAYPGIDAVRLVSEHSQDGAPFVTEVFEATR